VGIATGIIYCRVLARVVILEMLIVGSTTAGTAAGTTNRVYFDASIL
jgi:hypothetical protein